MKTEKYNTYSSRKTLLERPIASKKGRQKQHLALEENEEIEVWLNLEGGFRVQAQLSLNFGDAGLTRMWCTTGVVAVDS